LAVILIEIDPAETRVGPTPFSQRFVQTGEKETENNQQGLGRNTVVLQNLPDVMKQTDPGEFIRIEFRMEPGHCQHFAGDDDRMLLLKAGKLIKEG